MITKIADLSISVRTKMCHLREKTEMENIFGERQLELDIWANELYLQEINKTNLVKLIASEEEEEIKNTGKGKFAITIDPLDGSSNLLSNNSCGTIIGIYRGSYLPMAGKNQVAALYVLYGPMSSLVYTTRRGVHEFVYIDKEFVLSRENIKMPSSGLIYGVGGLRWKWESAFLNWMQELENGKLKVRYSGALVADFNQILVHGGFFGYPALTDAPSGKLRLFFEANPLALIAVKAGAKASTGTQPILEVSSENIFQKTPVFFGCPDIIKGLEKALQESRHTP